MGMRVWVCVGLGLGLGCVGGTARGGAEDATQTGGAATEEAGGPGGLTGQDSAASSGELVIACDDPEAEVGAIWVRSCTDGVCHDSQAAGGLDLSGADWPAQLVGQPSSLCDGEIRIIPADPASSLLYQKLVGSTACGVPMPVGDSLSPSEIGCVVDWIEQLAPAACETCGGSSCIDFDTSAQHCGACNAPCPSGVPCVAGECACPGETRACGATCVDVASDGMHCGSCDGVCGAGTVCNQGSCASGCGDLTQCAGGCVDTDSHPLHCGQCNNGCGSGTTCVAGVCTCTGDPVSYVDRIEPIFVEACTNMGCHGAPMPKERLDLRVGQGYGDLVGVGAEQCVGRSRVVPGDPPASYLLDKLRGTNLCSGTKMPKNESLSPESIELVASWICHGAQE